MTQLEGYDELLKELFERDPKARQIAKELLSAEERLEGIKAEEMAKSLSEEQLKALLKEIETALKNKLH